MKETKLKRKFYKQNKGITLIALVITIIVILILAGVAISTLMGENGLINRTISAKEKTEKAGTLENIQLAVVASKTNENNAVNEYDLKDALTKAFGAEGTGYTIKGNSSKGWTITVGDLKYEVSASGEVEEYVPPVPVDIATLINTANQNENPYADKTKPVKDASSPDAQIFYIPEGFKLASEVTATTTVNDGIVVEDGEGNQFVWVPVPVAVWDGTQEMSTSGIDLYTAENPYTPMATTYTYPNDSTGKTYYRGMLYEFSSGTTSTYKSGYNVGTANYREPSLVTENNDYYAPMSSIAGQSYDAIYANSKLGLTNAMEFGAQMQADYDEMIESVATYGGFYVGRYETGIETVTENGTEKKKIVSKNADPNINSNVTTANASQTKTNTWYGLYKEQRNFATSGSVRSSMIWGSQYDAMMNWMAKTGKTVGTSNSGYNKDTITGASTTDVINKIYDLYGCHYEWTLEAYDTIYRTKRGGYSGLSGSPATRFNYYVYPDGTDSSYGSRLSLYIM